MPKQMTLDEFHDFYEKLHPVIGEFDTADQMIHELGLSREIVIDLITELGFAVGSAHIAGILVGYKLAERNLILEPEGAFH